jgi:prolyl oligopeptidase
MTDHEAPKGRVVAIDIRKPDAKKWRELIAQRDDALEAASIVGDRIFARYLDNASSKVRVHRLDGSVEHELALPGLGSVGGFTGKRGHSETFYEFSSFTTPSTIYRYEIGSHKAEVFRRPQLQFDPNDYETTQVFVTSKDGTRVPMFLSHKKGLGPNGALPTYLYGYGGFNISITPRFSVPNLVWMEMGGLLAVPTLRGGGEFGEQWHQAGIKTRKQNVFDDFIAAATWLIDNGYTNPQRLAIGGRSNGGLLVGAAITQRPDLFAAALPGVGVLDMLRFNKFTIGWAWESDYGSPENPEEFAALLAYSPLHNVEARRYPATLAYTADHDDRVVPAHSYKFIAALQHAHTGDAPILIRIDTKAGHGAGKPTTKQVEEWADLWGFLVYTLQMNGPGPSKAG